MNTIALIISIVLFIIGIMGTILPALPGAILVFGGMLIYGFMTQFESLDLYFYVIQGLLLLFTFFADFLVTAVSTKKFGGSKRAQCGAAIGTVLGVIIFGPLGIILGPFVGATISELIDGIEVKKALYTGLGSVFGALGGTVSKIIIEIIMIIYFFIKI